MRWECFVKPADDWFTLRSWRENSGSAISQRNRYGLSACKKHVFSLCFGCFFCYISLPPHRSREWNLEAVDLAALVALLRCVPIALKDDVAALLRKSKTSQTSIWKKLQSFWALSHLSESDHGSLQLLELLVDGCVCLFVCFNLPF